MPRFRLTTPQGVQEFEAATQEEALRQMLTRGGTPSPTAPRTPVPLSQPEVVETAPFQSRARELANLIGNPQVDPGAALQNVAVRGGSLAANPLAPILSRLMGGAQEELPEALSPTQLAVGGAALGAPALRPLAALSVPGRIATTSVAGATVGGLAGGATEGSPWAGLAEGVLAGFLGLTTEKALGATLRFFGARAVRNQAAGEFVDWVARVFGTPSPRPAGAAAKEAIPGFDWARSMLVGNKGMEVARQQYRDAMDVAFLQAPTIGKVDSPVLSRLAMFGPRGLPIRVGGSLAEVPRDVLVGAEGQISIPTAVQALRRLGDEIGALVGDPTASQAKTNALVSAWRQGVRDLLPALPAGAQRVVAEATGAYSRQMALRDLAADFNVLMEGKLSLEALGEALNSPKGLLQLERRFGEAGAPLLEDLKGLLRQTSRDAGTGIIRRGQLRLGLGSMGGRPFFSGIRGPELPGSPFQPPPGTGTVAVGIPATGILRSPFAPAEVERPEAP